LFFKIPATSITSSSVSPMLQRSTDGSVAHMVRMCSKSPASGHGTQW
jgi:hypothetical protein